MREDGSPPENVLRQLPQNTNDLEACMPPTSRSRPDRYSASPSAIDNTQTGRVHRMPSSRNQRVQSSIRWSCVQLKQHRQSEAGTMSTGPSLTKTDYQMRIELGLIPKFPSSSRAIEGRPAVLLEVPSSPWLGIIHWQKIQQPTGAPTTRKEAQTMPHGHKSESAVNHPTAPNEETRKIATNLLEST